MATIDERIVKMRFDASQFQSGISGTMSLLDRFKKALNLKGADSGLNDIQKTADNFKMDGMASSVDTVQSRFTALQGVALGVFASIGSMAASTGLGIVKSFTLSPVMDGFREYETKINAIQRIQANTASKGTSMQEITDTLDELNTYSDKTIYNFGQMADNIGRFTSAGVDLQTATKSIKGISNMAALAGASSADSARVGTQLAQAIGGGDIRLQDWMSVENAGMDSQAFKQALFEAGKQAGSLKGVGLDTTFEDWTKSAGSFRNTLQDGWLTVDVMNEALENMTGDLDENALMAKGYSQETAHLLATNAKMALSSAADVKTFTQMMDTLKESAGSAWVGMFESMFGGLEDSKKVFTGLTNAIQPMLTTIPNAISDIFTRMRKVGAMDDIMEGFKNVFSFIKALIAPIGEAFKNIFPPATDEKLKSIGEGFKNLTSHLKVTDGAAKGIKVIFEAIFSVIKFGISLFTSFGSAAATVAGFFGTLGSAALTVIGNLDRVFGSIQQIASILFKGDYKGGTNGLFGLNDESSGIVDFLFKVREAAVKAKDAITDFFSNGIKGGMENMGDWDWGKILGAGLAAGVAVVIAKLVKLFKNGFNLEKLDFVQTIKDTIEKLGDTFDKAGGTFESITGTFDSLKDSLQAMQNDLNANILLKIAAAVGILALSMILLANVPGDDLAKAGAAIAGLAAGLLGSMKVFQIISSGDTGGMAKVGTSMILLSVALLILAAAVKTLADLSWEELGRGLAGATVGIGLLIAAVKLMPGDMGIKTGLSLILLAAALNVMASAVSKFGEMDLGTMVQGLAGIAVALGLLVATVALMPDEASMMSMGLGLILITAALNIMAAAVQTLGSMDLGTMVQGIAGMGAGLLIIAGAVALMPKDMALTGAGLILVAAGITILAGAIQTLGGMSIESVGIALLALGGSLLIIAGAVALMPKDMALTGAGLILIAAGVSVLAGALAQLGGMSIESVGTALFALAGGMLILTAAVNAMPPTLPLIGAGLVIAAAGISILAGAMTTLGGMSIGEVATSLLALAGSLTVLAVAAYAMSGAIVGAIAMLAIAAALRVLVPALKSLSEMSLGDMLKTMANLGLAFGALGAAAALLTPITPLILGLGLALTMIAVSIGVATKGIDALIQAFNNLASLGGDNLNSMIENVNNLNQAFTEAFTGLASNAGQIQASVQTIVDAIMVTLQQGIQSMAPNVTQALNSMLMAAFSSVTNMGAMLLSAFQAMFTPVLAYIQMSSKQMGQYLVMGLQMGLMMMIAYIPTFGQVGVLIGTTIATGVQGSVGAVSSAFLTLVQSALSIMMGSTGIFTSAGVTMTRGIVVGILSQIGAVGAASMMVGQAYIRPLMSLSAQLAVIGRMSITVFVAAVASGLSSAASALSASAAYVGRSISAGMANGISSGRSQVISAAVSVASAAISAAKTELKTHSPSRVFYGIGKNVSDGLAIGISDNSATAVNASVEMSRDVSRSSLGVFDGIKNAAKRASQEVKSQYRSMTQTITGQNEEASFAVVPNKGRASFDFAGVMDQITKVAETTAKLISAIAKAKEDIDKINAAQYEDEEKSISLEEKRISLLDKRAELDKKHAELAESDDPLAADKLALEERKYALDQKKYDEEVAQYNKSKNIGQAIGQGLRDGINAAFPGAGDAMTNGANGLLNNFKAQFGIHSPSRVMAKMGTYIIDGLRKGISEGIPGLFKTSQQMTDAVLESAKELEAAFDQGDYGYSTLASVFGDDDAKDILNKTEYMGHLFNSVNEVKAALQGNDWGYASLTDLFGSDVTGKQIVDAAAQIHDWGVEAHTAIDQLKIDLNDIPDPVIRPVIDLSGIDQGIRDISTFGMSGIRSAALDTMSRFNQTRNQVISQAEQLANTPISFTQNNYSPTALSTNDIYRQTNNQIGFFKNRLSEVFAQ